MTQPIMQSVGRERKYLRLHSFLLEAASRRSLKKNVRSQKKREGRKKNETEGLKKNDFQNQKVSKKTVEGRGREALTINESMQNAEKPTTQLK